MPGPRPLCHFTPNSLRSSPRRHLGERTTTMPMLPLPSQKLRRLRLMYSMPERVVLIQGRLSAANVERFADVCYNLIKYRPASEEVLCLEKVPKSQNSCNFP